MNGRSRRVVWLALAVVLLILGALPAAAAGTLDQAQEVSLGAESFTGANQVGQTFTAGLTGGLDQLDLYLGTFGPGPGGDLIVAIHATTGGLPTGPPLATEAVPSVTVPAQPNWISVPFDPPAPVSAGTQYAFVLLNPVFSQHYGIGSAPGNLYPRGIGLRSGDNGRTWHTTLDTDRAFRTYVTTETPTCNAAATIYVGADGLIVGGPDNGKLYRGRLRGTTGADVIVGTANNDHIHAKAGDDVVCAGAGNDLVEAGAGNDRVFGDDGDDTLNGGAGKDTMTGGLGADAFNGGPGADTATDFNPGEGDTQTSVP